MRSRTAEECRIEERKRMVRELLAHPYRTMSGREIAERMLANMAAINGAAPLDTSCTRIDLEDADRFAAIVSSQDAFGKELLHRVEPDSWHYARLWTRRGDLVCLVAAEHYAHLGSASKVAGAMHRDLRRESDAAGLLSRVSARSAALHLVLTAYRGKVPSIRTLHRRLSGLQSKADRVARTARGRKGQT